LVYKITSDLGPGEFLTVPEVALVLSDIRLFYIDRYRITEGVNLPFKVLPTIKELGRTRMEVNVKV